MQVKEFICASPTDCIFKEERVKPKRKKEKGIKHLHVRSTAKNHQQLLEDIKVLKFKSFQSWWEKIEATTHIAAERARQHGYR